MSKIKAWQRSFESISFANLEQEAAAGLEQPFRERKFLRPFLSFVGIRP